MSQFCVVCCICYWFVVVSHPHPFPYLFYLLLLSLVRLLVAYGADPNFFTPLCRSALITAATASQPLAVEALLRLGARPNGLLRKYGEAVVDDVDTGLTLTELRDELAVQDALTYSGDVPSAVIELFSYGENERDDVLSAAAAAASKASTQQLLLASPPSSTESSAASAPSSSSGSKPTAPSSSFVSSSSSSSFDPSLSMKPSSAYASADDFADINIDIDVAVLSNPASILVESSPSPATPKRLSGAPTATAHAAAKMSLSTSTTASSSSLPGWLGTAESPSPAPSLALPSTSSLFTSSGNSNLTETHTSTATSTAVAVNSSPTSVPSMPTTSSGHSHRLPRYTAQLWHKLGNQTNVASLTSSTSARQPSPSNGRVDVSNGGSRSAAAAAAAAVKSSGIARSAQTALWHAVTVFCKPSSSLSKLPTYAYGKGAGADETERKENKVREKDVRLRVRGVGDSGTVFRSEEAEDVIGRLVKPSDFTDGSGYAMRQSRPTTTSSNTTTLATCKRPMMMSSRPSSSTIPTSVHSLSQDDARKLLTLRLLLLSGANPNSRISFGHTPLFEAARHPTTLALATTGTT